MKKMMRKLMTHFYAKDLSIDEQKEIQTHILLRNWVRAKIVFLIIVLSEIALILFVDLPLFTSQDATYQDVDLWFFYMHLIIGVYAMIAHVISKHYAKQTKIDNLVKQEILLYGFAFGLLILLTIINSFDQLTTGQITVFVIYVILSGFVILVKPGVDVLFYLCTYIFFAIGVMTYQDDALVLNSHLINGGFMVVGALVVAKLTYYNYYILYAKTLKLNQANQELSYLSHYDVLTKLPNRRYFYQQLASLRNSEPNMKGYLLLIDFDDFKKVNDEYGHQVGDQVLEDIGQVFKDFTTEPNLVARFGGEEFMIFLKGVPKEEAITLANNLCKTVKKYVYERDSYDIMVTVSIGLSLYDGANETALDTSYKQADEALYEAKRKGKNQVAFWSKQS